MTTSNKVGEIIRVEYDKETGDVRIVMNITDEFFKNRVLHNKDFDDIISITGRDVIVIASNKTRKEE